MRPPKVFVLGLAAALGLAIAADAQTPPPPPPGGPAGDTAKAWRPGEMREHREARRAEHMKALHDVLAIRAEQEGAFQAFAAAMAPEPGPGLGEWRRGPGREGDRDGAPHGRPTTPERLDLMLKRFDEHAARMRAAIERRAAATKSLYAALSPEQQRTLDALPGLIGRGDWGGAEGMRGGRPDRSPLGPGAHAGPGAGD